MTLRIELPTHYSTYQLVCLGDAHNGHKECDYTALLQMRDWLRKAPDRRGWIGMGDLMETVLATGSPPGAIWDQDVLPDEQKAWWKREFKDTPPLLLISGNHDDRVFKQTSGNYTKDLAEHFGCPFLDVGGYVELKLGWFVYTIWLAHGKGASQRPAYHLEKVIEKMGVVADIVAIGHIHQLYHQVWVRHHKEGPYVMHGIRTGGYLSPDAAYTRKALFPLAKIGSPIVTLYKNFKKIDVDITTGVP